MAYIGAEPLPGQNREVDDISSSFNGSTTAFTLQVNGLNVSPETANNILVNIGGVIQNPGTDYTIAASTITFTTAPASGLSFFAIILGAGINTATVADDTIGASKLIDTAVTAGSYTTADITVDAQGRITAAASGSISNAEIANNAVTTAKIADQAVDLTKLPHGTSSNNGKFLRANNGADPTFESIPAGITINNQADNRIITATGTTDTLNGEANLTFNGQKLNVVANDGGSDVNFSVRNTNASGFGAYISGGGSSSQYILRLDDKDQNEKFRVTSSGDVGIGTGSPGHRLHLKGTDTAYGGNVAVGPILELEDAAGRKSQLIAPGAAGESGVGTPTAHDFTLFTSNTERMRILSSGNVGIKTAAPIGTLDVYDGTFCLTKPNSNSSSRNWRFVPDNAAAGNLGLQVSTAAGGSTFSNAVEIKSNGNVGINETSPQQTLHVHNDTSYQGIFVNGNGAPRVAFARSTTTTGEWSVGIDGTNGNDFAITNSNDNTNRKLIISSAGVTAVGTLTSGGNATFGGIVTFNGSYQQGNASAGLSFFGSSAQSRGVVISHGANNMRPTHNNDVDLGTSGQRWKTIYSNNSLNTSDKNLKNTIVDSDLGLSFINKLRPVSYKWNQEEEENLDTKTHYGFIAQEIETALVSESKNLDDFAGVFKPDNYKEDGTGDAMGISIGEIVSPLVKAVQELSAEVEILKTKVAALEAA